MKWLEVLEKVNVKMQKTKTFKDAPKSVNKLLNNPKFKNGIDKAMKYLGEEK